MAHFMYRRQVYFPSTILLVCPHPVLVDLYGSDRAQQEPAPLARMVAVPT